MVTSFLVGVALAASLAVVLNVLARRWKQVGISAAIVVVFGVLGAGQMNQSLQTATTGPTTAPVAP